LIVLILFPSLIQAQQADREVHEQCATMERLQLQFEGKPGLKAKFEQERAAFNDAVKRKAYRVSERDGADQRTAFSIPVIFHIVLTNPDQVTDAKILAQLQTLNTNYSGSNADSTKIPSYFKSLFGKSGIQFCLAQRTPTGQATSGIERVQTTKTSFNTNDDGVKHAADGGANSWDTKTYLNVWICGLSNNVLGYSTLPQDGGAPEDQGVVIDYRSLPGGSQANYSLGKTLVHETGHYFNLYHIWGDDGGGCTGSDFVDDTPNQADQTKSCFTGIKTDACTPGGNGIMYQNFMDYSFDSCMVMFTAGQVERMENAVLAYRSTLLNTSVCTPRNYDARLSSIDRPSTRLCGSPFAPAVTIKNQGSQPLTSLNISSKIDNGNIDTYTWKGSLAYMATTTVSLNNITSPAGSHTLTIYVSSPNNNADEDVRNDTIISTFQFYNPVATLSEGFEGSTFPPAGWDIGNADNNITWNRVTGISKTGTASVRMENFNYPVIGEKDDLRLPNVTLQNVDSAFLSFQVAAAVYANPASASSLDTLQVLASSDCGQTYTSVYKKFGNELMTRAATAANFVPTSSEWRKDSIDLGNYIGQSNLLLAFRNINGYENNIYLDDINLRTVVINPNLKRLGFLTTPNPTSGVITAQFYPQPNTLRAIQVFTIAGQKLLEINIAEGQANNNYRLDISRYSAGMYIIRAVFTDRVATTKIIKY
jgi:hypothetical protein